MKEKYNKLIDIINEADYNYHTLDNPTITDQEYDSYLRELFEIEESHPELIRADSPTKRAGGEILSGFNKVTHKIPMLSLSDVFNYDEIRNHAKNYYTETVKNNWFEFIEKAKHKQTAKRVMFISSEGGHFSELLELNDVKKKIKDMIDNNEYPTNLNI